MKKSFSRDAFTLIELLVVIAIIAILIGLLVPAVNAVLIAAQRTATSANLNQIGLGVHAYYDAYNYVPYNGLRDNWGTPADPQSGSWGYQVLPYIDQGSLYNSMKTVTTNGIITGPALAVPLYVDPGRGRPGFVYDPNTIHTGPTTDYMLNPWLNDPKNGDTGARNRKLKWGGITDGPSNTILIGSGSLPTSGYAGESWGSYDETWFVGGFGGSARDGFLCAQDSPTVDFHANNRGQWGGPYNSGCHFVFCDRAVHIITYGTDLTAFIRPDDGMRTPHID